MSLYCFGKLKLVAGSETQFVFPAKVMIRRYIDPGDAEEIETIDQLAGDGLYFSICDDPGSVDATRLWLETMSKAPDNVLESHLGGTIHALLFNSQISVGGIAFVDGGIRTILSGTPEQCWLWFLERAGKPWDTIDNPMLIWASATRRHSDSLICSARSKKVRT